MPLWVSERVRWNHPALTTQPPSPISPEEQLASWLSSPSPPWSTGRSTEACGVSKTGTWWPPWQRCGTDGTWASPFWRNRRQSLCTLTSTFNINMWSLPLGGDVFTGGWRLTQAGSMSSLARWETCVYIKSKHLYWLGLNNMFFTLSWIWSDHLSSFSTNE